MRKRLGRIVACGVASSFMLVPTFAKELTLDDRVSAQWAIEQVRWAHRIWPTENRGPKPPLSSVMSLAVVRAKVEDYLKMSDDLASRWGSPITKDDLQAEIDRMSHDTRDARMLRELYAALGDDPVVIAETLGRQLLANRRIREAYASDVRIHGPLRAQVEEALARATSVSGMGGMGGVYSVVTLGAGRSDGGPEITADGTVRLSRDAWRSTVSQIAAWFGAAPDAIPTARVSGVQEDAEGFYVGAVLERSADTLKVATVRWAKRPFDPWWAAERAGVQATAAAPVEGLSVQAPTATGNCTDDIATWDTWLPTATGGPTSRVTHTAVWTGTEMVVWGGYSVGGWLATGGRYTPATDSWTATAIDSGTPSARAGHVAVWTGTEMIVWGGIGAGGLLNTGGRYDPTSDGWTAVSVGANVPSPRVNLSAVWTGSEMIVWGGRDASGYTSTGGGYDPGADGWTAVSSTNAPSGRSEHTAVWTGTEMIVWGGLTRDANGVATYLGTGGRYAPGTDTWATVSTVAAPSVRADHTAVWTSTEMIVWGGRSVAFLNSGARYSPSTDSWVSVSSSNVPSGRSTHDAVWTGTEMMIWGGIGDGGFLNSGGRYDPSRDAWRATSVGANVPDARDGSTAVWDGTEVYFWGGAGSSGYLATGARYCVGQCAPRVIYEDVDGDGYGNAAVSQLACDPFAGWVLDNTDCNDANPTVYPRAPEICDGLDNDCNSVVDDGGNALCNDGIQCTSDVCNGLAGCSNTPLSTACNDSNGCTADYCDALLDCQHYSANLDVNDFSASRVDGRDLIVFAAAWNTCSGDSAFDPAANLDPTTPCVDAADFHAFMQAFGSICP